MTPCLLLCLAAGLPADKPGPDEKAELKKLQGTWEVVSVEADGKPLPADRTKGWTLTIDGRNYALRAGDRAIEGEYKLSPLENPHAIDATRTGGADKGKTLLGVYDLRGDDLRMCFGRPGGEVRPKGFKTGGEGGGDRLYVLRRAKR